MLRCFDLYFAAGIGGSNGLFGMEDAAWWSEPVVEDLTVGDVVLLLAFTLAALLALRLALLVAQLAWRVMAYPFRKCASSPRRTKTAPRRKTTTIPTISTTTARTKRKADEDAATELGAIIHACHAELLRVVHKLNRECRSAREDDTQDLVASLTLSRHQEGFEHVTLEEVVRTLREIQAKDSSLLSAKLPDTLDQSTMEAALVRRKSLRHDWTRLQRVYSSFQSLQSSISRQRAYRKDSALRRRHQGSFDNVNEDVLRALSELANELPLGFTAEMFASLGSAMMRSLDNPQATSDATKLTRPYAPLDAVAV